jgi:hypothetical protein
MARTLSDEDVDAIANRVVEIIGMRLCTPQPAAAAPLAPPPLPEKSLPPKLAYTLKELSEELGISKVSLYRFEVRGLLRSAKLVSRFGRFLLQTGSATFPVNLPKRIQPESGIIVLLRLLMMLLYFAGSD